MIRLAMYKGPPTDALHRIGHRLICLWTRSIYSHCELVPGLPAPDGTSLCLSASHRDDGVRFKRINLGSGRWDVFDLPQFDDFDRDLAVQWFLDNDAAGYDYLGLLWFLLPARLEWRKRWFCSEAIAAALGLRDPHKFHPQKLLETLMD